MNRPYDHHPVMAQRAEQQPSSPSETIPSPSEFRNSDGGDAPCCCRAARRRLVPPVAASPIIPAAAARCRPPARLRHVTLHSPHTRPSAC